MTNNIETLKSQLVAFTLASEANKEKKSIGAELAETIKEAYKNNDKETIDFIDQERENKSPLFKTAKVYVSKAVRVGKAFQDGTFNATEHTQTALTLYDILSKGKKEQEEKARALSEKQARNHAALVAFLGSPALVDDFILNSDPITMAEAINQGLLMLGEEEAEQKRIAQIEALTGDIQNVKDIITSLYTSHPEGFDDVAQHVLNLAQALAKQAA